MTKYEERVVSEEEAKKLDLSGKGKVVKFQADGKVVVQVEVVKPGQESPNPEDIVTSIDVNTPRKIPFQITRIKKDKRVVIKRGAFTRGDLWVFSKLRQEKEPRAYYCDLKELAWVKYQGRWRWSKPFYKQELIFDVFYSEPMTAKGETPAWNEEIEEMKKDARVIQTKEVAKGPQPFKITRSVAIGMILAGIFLSFLGLSLNEIFHFVPNVVVHWVPG